MENFMTILKDPKTGNFIASVLEYLSRIKGLRSMRMIKHIGFQNDTNPIR